MTSPRTFESVDYEAFARDVKALGEEASKHLGEDDLKHLRKIELWGRLCTVLGYATAWIFPNPLSALLISQGAFTRWTTLMHHIGHRGYDRVPGVPARYTSKVFATGWRRFIDFPDWMVPEAWAQEHNVLHHYHTGDMGDPDLVERDIDWLRDARLPRVVKLMVISFFAISWKYSYYVPRTIRALQYARARRENRIGPSVADGGTEANGMYPFDTRALSPRQGSFSPFNARGRETWMRSLIPYAIYRFGLVPLLFLPISTYAWMSVLATSIMAEVFTNLHTFLVIAPNHAGEDLYRFEAPISDRAEHFVRSVLGSVNYNTGGDVNDFLQGFLNYQIEHHVWPDLPARQYQLLQPKLKALCQQHGVPYVQESMWKRVGKLLNIMTGHSSMAWAVTVPKAARSGAAEPAQQLVA